MLEFDYKVSNYILKCYELQGKSPFLYVFVTYPYTSKDVHGD